MNNAQPTVAVVIMNWNGRSFLERFLPSVCSSSYACLEIVVGDNASTDDSVEFLKESYPQIRILSNDKNYGYAGGYNRVLGQVEADYYVLLNSDVEVTPGWIEPVIRLMESDAMIAAAQPKLLWWSKKSTFEYAGAAGGEMDRFGYPFCRGRVFDHLEEDQGQYDEPEEIFWASGAAMFIRSSAWKLAGGFDADFFAHMEEIDLCWRLKIKGHKIMYCPDAKVYHVGGGTLNAESPFKTYLNFRNNLAMLRKNLPAGKVFPVIFIRFWLDFLTWIRFFVAGKPALSLAISKAHWHFLRDYRRNAAKASPHQPQFNDAGLFRGSVVWEYFVRKRITAREILHP